MAGINIKELLNLSREKIDWHKNPLLKIELEREDKDNVFCPPLDPYRGLRILAEYLLGEDWYIADPLGSNQVNFYIVKEILYNYSKKFRKEYKKYIKEKKKENGR